MADGEDLYPEVTTSDPNLIGLLSAIVAALGALNWGLIEMFDTNLLSDVLGLAGDGLMYAHVAVGIAGALLLIAVIDGSEVLS